MKVTRLIHHLLVDSAFYAEFLCANGLYGDCRLLNLANAEYTNCAAHRDMEAVRHPKMYVLVKEVTKEVSGNRKTV